MKRPIAYLLAASFSLLSANDTPWQINAEYNHIDDARFHHPDKSRHHHLSYQEALVLGTYKQPLDEKNGLRYGVGYLGSKFHFSSHPRFHQRHFDNALVSLGAYTKAIDRWKWEANLLMQINAEHFHLSRYTFFTGLLKGKYAWNNNRNLYAGLLFYTGMRYSRCLPVVGIDYTLSPHWKFNGIFPLNLSVTYGFNENWSCSGGLRYFLTRQRLGEDDKIRRGLVAYRNWGAEFGINFEWSKYLYFNAHIGETFAGKMRISNQHDRNRKHLVLGTAPYFGIEASLHF